MLKLGNHHSVIDAAQRSVDIDENFSAATGDRYRNAGCAARRDLESEFSHGSGSGPEPA